MKTAIINNHASTEDLAGPDNERRLLTRDDKREPMLTLCWATREM
jgi:hypothetical protein